MGSEHEREIPPADDTASPSAAHHPLPLNEGEVLVAAEAHHREQLERALHESEERFRATFEHAAAGFAHFAPDGRWLLVNQRLCDLLGYTRERLLTLRLHDVTHPDDLELTLTAAQRLETGDVAEVAMELRCLCADGHTLWIQATLSHVSSPPGGSHYFIAVIQDISERKRLEEERARLLASERAARAEAESATQELRDLQAITDTLLEHLSLDDLLNNLLARLHSIVTVDNAAVLLRSDDGHHLTVRATYGLDERLQEAAKYLKIPVGRGFAGRILASRQPLAIDDTDEFDLYDPMLRETVRSVAGVPLLVAERALGVLHVGCTTPHHFTARDLRLLRLAVVPIAHAIDHAELYSIAKTAGEIAEVRADQLEVILEAMADGVLVYDARARTMSLNAAGREMFGMRLQHVEHTSPEQWTKHVEIYDERGRPLPPDRWPVMRALRGETLTGPNVVDLRARAAGGELRELNVSAAPIYNAQEEMTGVVCVLRDVTERRRLEAERGHLLSVVSHELKTPLTTIKLRTQLLERMLERRNAEQERSFIGELDGDIERMNHLVNDLLDAARLERGPIELTKIRCDLAALCRRAAEEQMAATGRVITLHLPAEALDLEVDSPRILQVLTNLLSNALKYSPHGRPVSLSLREEPQSVTVLIHDEGPGIPPEYQPHIFERFYRVQSIPVQSGPSVGLGLGLYICRTIIERHEGAIGVESTVGEGSTFWFRLPRGIPSP